MNTNVTTNDFVDEKTFWEKFGIFIIGGILFLLIGGGLFLFFLNKEILYGDVDSNGKVESNDYLVLIENIKGNKKLSDKEIKIGDVDGSGEIDRIDANLILAYTSLAIEKFPVEEKRGPFRAGDVNQDDVVNVNDYDTIERYLEDDVLLDGYKEVLADVSNDGVVDEIDALLIQMYVDKKIGTFPVYKPDMEYVTLGDVDLNGKVELNDAEEIRKFLNGEIELDALQKKAADVNGNGMVDELDREQIINSINNTVVGGEVVIEKPKEEAPVSKPVATPTPTATPKPTVAPTAEPAVPTPTPMPIIYGDVNMDGVVNSKDLSLLMQAIENQKTLSNKQILRANVYSDNALDMLDVEIISKYCVGHYKEIGPDVKYFTLGDVNNDGSISAKDLSLILKYLENTGKLDEVQKKAADFNKDGKIDQSDVQAIMTYISNNQ